MAESPPNPELMRSLGRLVRGLSAVFWGMPVALVVCFDFARRDGLKWYYVAAPLASTGLLLFGLLQMGAFQRQERVWRKALDCCTLLACLNFGLSPFIYFWNKIPGNPYFTAAILTLLVSGLLFLGSLNWVLQRLGAMLPDEALRQETRQFTALNLNLLGATLLLGICYIVLGRIPNLPLYLNAVMVVLDSGSFWLLILLVLLPMAMTMALIWKTKEVILDNVFGIKTQEH